MSNEKMLNLIHGVNPCAVKRRFKASYGIRRFDEIHITKTLSARRLEEFGINIIQDVLNQRFVLIPAKLMKYILEKFKIENEFDSKIVKYIQEAIEGKR